jgi:L-threonylcarbamoyladenylate synthase
VLEIKDRPLTQGLLIVVHDFSQCEDWVSLPKDWIPVTMIKDRPVTWVAPATHRAPKSLLGPNQTLAFRISTHPIVKDLTKALGKPIVSTSANQKGEPSAMTPEEVMRACGHAITGITLGYLGGLDAPSTIRHVDGTILRA